MESSRVYTIGHSTRTFDEFVDIVKGFGVETVVDVRTVPRSRTNPQYNLDTFPGQLAQVGIRHEQIEQLGGLRKKSRTVPEDVNGFWDNRSFHNYADYALSDAFETGLIRLMELSKSQCCAIMCAEAVWWRCHRRIVTDYLLLRGIEVIHIMDREKSNKAVMNPAAKVSGTQLTYPAGT
ncbi:MULTISPECIES: DUF488 domain-containing protein [Pseudomonas]|uniref:DUF488 domain-containing protein n=1 Tax=Pseudomonas TaxID=286 RepID=UPI001BE5ECA6|nr:MULTISPECIES: DUF488 domain-containing protein [Pseudomonas]MBT2338433.1 DUF488 domain-containing protein [Pseudomonas fluorescens]MCD4531136.1 DUF488 domain-containing protein [Pseudomonas sp. C3-2018]